MGASSSSVTIPITWVQLAMRLTRRRKQLVGERERMVNRLQRTFTAMVKYLSVR